MQIRYWNTQANEDNLIDAMRNDLRAQNPNWRERQINDTVIERLLTIYFGVFQGCTSPYASINLPECMEEYYGEKNTFLIPEYEAYR